MSTLPWLLGRGVKVALDGDENIKLSGLATLDPACAAEAVKYAKRFKERLLTELLYGDRGPYSRFKRRKLEVRSRLDDWRIARPWLLERYDRLQAAGFTRRELFVVGKLAYPYRWGLAWSSYWTDDEWTPSLSPEGHINWTRYDPVRREEIVLVSRPMGLA